MKNNVLKKGKLIAFLLFLVISLVLPLILINDPYKLHVLLLVVISVALASSLNLITGYAGQLSFAHAAFYGIGAYASAIFTLDFGLSFGTSILLATIFSGLVGALLGIPCLRLKGPYLAIATIGFQQMVVIIFSQWTSVTRGPMGITGIPKPQIFGFEFESILSNYYLLLGLTLLIILIIYRLLRSKMGLQIIAVREDETPARSIGVNTTYIKMVAFVISSAMAGSIGSFYAHYIGNIDPYLFNINMSSTILVSALVGGMGTIAGPILGASLITVLPEFLRFLQDYRMITYGAIVILVIIFMPSGLIGLFNKLRDKFTAKASSRTPDGMMEQ